MKSTIEIRKIYTGIQHQLNNLIPENWESIYLYASVVKQLNNLETWEMYFYYIPTGFFKKNPINVYEVPNKFNVDEPAYLELVDNLCNTIKTLHKVYKSEYNKEWTNMVIAIKDEQFLVEYNDNNLLKSKYTSQDRHLIFKHKYLNIPLDNFAKNDKLKIQEYLDDEEYQMVYDRYFEYIPKNEVHNYIEYEKEKTYQEDLYDTQLFLTEKKKKNNIFVILYNLIMKRKNRKIIKKLVEPDDDENFVPKIQILCDK